MQRSPQLRALRMNTASPTKPDHPRTGFILGLLAYALWGVLPIYFKLLVGIPAFDIVAHRIVWSLPFLALLIAVSRAGPKVREVLGRPKTVAILAVSALLIGANWL